jgi:hypothetical protein
VEKRLAQSVTEAEAVKAQLLQARDETTRVQQQQGELSAQHASAIDQRERRIAQQAATIADLNKQARVLLEPSQWFWVADIVVAAVDCVVVARGGAAARGAQRA